MNKKMKGILLIILNLALIFFGVNIIFEFVPFESKRINPITIIIILAALALINFKRKKKEAQQI